MTDILEVRDLEKTFGSVVAARDISVTVPAQQTVGIIGANGAGKTTFVNMITGHLCADQGLDPVRGARHHRTAIPRYHAARHLAFVPGGAGLSDHDGGREHEDRRGHRKGARRHRQPDVPWLDAPETAAESEAALELFQIARYRDARAATLPQGVRKLLDIAMAVAGAPRLLLLDEPTSGISIEEKFGLMEVVMSALKTRKITVLFVEHDMDIVGRFADRVLAFYDGTVIADEKPEAVLANPKVQTLISGTQRAHLGAVDV